MQPASHRAATAASPPPPRIRGSYIAVSRTLAGVTAALLALLLAPALQADESAGNPTVSVQGEARQQVAPDMATLRLDVVVDSIDVSVARSDVDATVGRALQVLADAGVDDDDIDSTGLTVSPQYRWLQESRQQELTGYRVNRSLKLTLRNLDRLGPLLEALTEAGVNRVHAPQLALHDDEAVYRQVLADATRNARGRAEAIAAALDRELGGPVSVAVISTGMPQPLMMERAAMMADNGAGAVGDSYKPGLIEYAVQVQASFSLR